MNKIYPDSGIELSPFSLKHYDTIMNVMSLGYYNRFITNAIKAIGVKNDDKILDLGCGTGRNTGLMSSNLGVNGRITGMDISELMEKQFINKFKNDNRINFIRGRADIPFHLGMKFDKILMSFVIHGFPHEVRKVIIENITEHLHVGGAFFMLDFAEFNMIEMPALHRFIFKTIECKYAFDFIEKDWKSELKGIGFNQFEEVFFVKKYVRLLKSVKSS